ncbi:hypothetical protein ETD83_00055 [Actinomadura soli]|uniref:Uncharacterized protein n=1 Tax=Actinomadura soli TaxID=2508997 RepID=A0A5C4JK04_9ACTN|nr:hypothetical protein [Actinomadura soli]TMR07419.1 hypothetical protein ETD83_00055 [Actinomadura soli]
MLFLGATPTCLTAAGRYRAWKALGAPLPPEPSLATIALALADLNTRVSPWRALVRDHLRECVRTAVIDVLRGEAFTRAEPGPSDELSDAALSRLAGQRVREISRQADPEMARTHPLLLTLHRFAEPGTDPLVWLAANAAQQAVEIAFKATIAACARACDPGDIQALRTITAAERRLQPAPYNKIQLAEIVLGRAGWQVCTTARTRWLGISQIADDLGTDYLVTGTSADETKRWRTTIRRVRQTCRPPVPEAATAIVLTINPMEPDESVIRVNL